MKNLYVCFSLPLLGCSWPLLGRSWPLVGRSWMLLSRSWGALGRSCAALGLSLVTLGWFFSLSGSLFCVASWFLDVLSLLSWFIGQALHWSSFCDFLTLSLSFLYKPVFVQGCHWISFKFSFNILPPHCFCFVTLLMWGGLCGTYRHIFICPFALLLQNVIYSSLIIFFFSHLRLPCWC